ncbi:M13 family metallopeptidase N-terminal domain-containing protein [Aspergillus saccharolyticus JOP 1030-1]|uniref:Zincin n=1 Tax=Aspergillus saccharolyticus JOP 1030-1 TaxID=1450539 RepID=A0A318ZVT0_9EURO|nr:zincin [Aspergillus saccharolyticus JOP 1030-1]PYH48180.1 zincin [Aspergillus saccharolyticus JOP 1030-1]
MVETRYYPIPVIITGSGNEIESVPESCIYESTDFLNIGLTTLPLPGLATNNEVCKSEACYQVSAELLQGITSESALTDPCTDLHSYVCGGWSQLHSMRPDQANIGPRTVMQDHSEEFIRTILETDEALEGSYAANNYIANLRKAAHGTNTLSFSSPLTSDWPSSAHYLDPGFAKGYVGTVERVLRVLKINNAESIFDPEMAKSFVRLEFGIAGIAADDDTGSFLSTSDQLVSLAQFKGLIPNLDIDEVLKDLNVSRLMPVLVPSRGQTDPKIMQAYLSWKLIQRYYSHVMTDSLRPLQDFLRQLAGQTPEYERERWRFCVQNVRDSLGWIVSRAYVQERLSETDQDYARDVVYNIQNKLKQIISESFWMSEETRTRSIGKHPIRWASRSHTPVASPAYDPSAS